jgi:hypothetical protein
MKKGKNNRTFKIILIIVFVGLFFALLTLLKPSILGYFVATGRPIYCKEGTVRIGSYILSGECMPENVFANLPPYPDNLNEVKILVSYGKIKDLTTIKENYFKQPEFYLNWDPAGISSFFEPKEGYFGALGFGAYPADIVATVKPGEALKLGTFFKTSWGVQNYQGMQLVPVFPEKAESKMGNQEVEQDPQEVRDYFDISIEPGIFLLEPAFGVFEKDWVRNVSVIIKIKPNTPSGKYAVGISPITPPSEFDDQWTIEYGLRYVSVGGHSIGRPFFQVFIEVQD